MGAAVGVGSQLHAPPPSRPSAHITRRRLHPLGRAGSFDVPVGVVGPCTEKRTMLTAHSPTGHSALGGGWRPPPPTHLHLRPSSCCRWSPRRGCPAPGPAQSAGCCGGLRQGRQQGGRSVQSTARPPGARAREPQLALVPSAPALLWFRLMSTPDTRLITLLCWKTVSVTSRKKRRSMRALVTRQSAARARAGEGRRHEQQPERWRTAQHSIALTRAVRNGDAVAAIQPVHLPARDAPAWLKQRGVP